MYKNGSCQIRKLVHTQSNKSIFCSIIYFNFELCRMHWRYLLSKFLFQMFIWLTAVLITLVLVVLRVEGVMPRMSWWVVLSPMFIADALNTYFCVIVLIRMYLNGVLKPAALRALWSFSVLTLGFIFKFLLCKKLVKPTEFEYSAVMSPVFILLQLIMIRACHLN